MNREKVQEVRQFLAKRVIGQPDLVDGLMLALLADGHIIVEGPPGLAKTRAIKELAKCVEGSFHRVTCAFGIRNFEHKELGLKEFHRVLKPGGKAVILELSLPQNRIIRWFYDLYFMHVLPWVGGLISGDKAAYKYLPASVHAFPAPSAFLAMMQEAGFQNVCQRPFSLGLCRMYVGEK